MILDGRAQHFRAISILRKICNHADLMLRSDQSKLGCSLLEPIVDKDDEEDDKVRKLLAWLWWWGRGGIEIFMVIGA